MPNAPVYTQGNCKAAGGGTIATPLSYARTPPQLPKHTRRGARRAQGATGRRLPETLHLRIIAGLLALGHLRDLVGEQGRVTVPACGAARPPGLVWDRPRTL